MLTGAGFSLKRLPELSAERSDTLIDALYAPEERFAQGFFKFRKDVLKQSEEEARQATQDECRHYIHHFKESRDDPNIFVLCTRHNGEEQPVGMFCLRPLDSHPRGADVLDALQRLDLTERYAGDKGIVHSFSLLKGYRDLQMLKFVFVSIAVESLKRDHAHLFFFMSDHRLKSIYQRYGLEFPLDLMFRDSRHSVGCYSLSPDNLEKIRNFIAEQSALMGL